MTLPISRRQFVRQLAVFGGAALLFFPDETHADASVPWVALGPADKFRKDSVTQVDLPGAQDTEVVSVAHRSDGNFLVFSARCTHLGCVVDWDSHHRQFICPCHGGRYDAAGKNVGGPPPSPLRTLATRVDDHGILRVQPPSARTAKK